MKKCCSKDCGIKGKGGLTNKKGGSKCHNI